MDPTQCYLDLLAAIELRDVETVEEHAETLRAWLARGGFAPADFRRVPLLEWMPEPVCRDLTLCNQMVAPH